MRQKKDPFCDCNSCSPSFFLLHHNLTPFANLITPQNLLHKHLPSISHTLSHVNLFYWMKIVTFSKLEIFRVKLMSTTHSKLELFQVVFFQSSAAHEYFLPHDKCTSLKTRVQNLFHTHASSTSHTLLHVN